MDGIPANKEVVPGVVLARHMKHGFVPLWIECVLRTTNARVHAIPIQLDSADQLKRTAMLFHMRVNLWTQRFYVEAEFLFDDLPGNQRVPGDRIDKCSDGKLRATLIFVDVYISMEVIAFVLGPLA